MRSALIFLLCTLVVQSAYTMHNTDAEEALVNALLRSGNFLVQSREVLAPMVQLVEKVRNKKIMNFAHVVVRKKDLKASEKTILEMLWMNEIYTSLFNHLSELKIRKETYEYALGHRNYWAREQELQEIKREADARWLSERNGNYQSRVHEPEWRDLKGSRLQSRDDYVRAISQAQLEYGGNRRVPYGYDQFRYEQPAARQPVSSPRISASEYKQESENNAARMRYQQTIEEYAMKGMKQYIDQGDAEKIRSYLSEYSFSESSLCLLATYASECEQYGVVQILCDASNPQTPSSSDKSKNFDINNSNN